MQMLGKFSKIAAYVISLFSVFAYSVGWAVSFFYGRLVGIAPQFQFSENYPDFVVVSVAFLITMLLLALYGAMIVAWFPIVIGKGVGLFHIHVPSENSVFMKWWFAFCSFLIFSNFIFFGFVLYINASPVFMDYVSVISGAALGGFVLSMFSHAMATSTLSRQKQTLLWLGAIFFSCFIIFSMGNGSFLLKHTMKFAGIRLENISVLVDEDVYRKITRIAESKSIALFDCKKRDQNYMVHGVTMLWYGSGSNSIMSIGGVDDTNFPVSSSSLMPIIKSKNSERCYVLKGDSLFDIKESEIKTEALFEIDRLKAEIKAVRNIENISIIGHSDPMRYHDNGSLSLERAEKVKSALLTGDPFFQKIEISTQGVGDRYVQVECTKAKPGNSVEREQEIRCNAPNRRVEIKVKIKG